MSREIEQRLREQALALPEPDPQAAVLGRQVLEGSVPPASKTDAVPRRRVLALALAFVALAASFGGGYGVRGAVAGADPDSLTSYEGWNRLGVGVSVEVPPRWSGRVLFLDATGLYGNVLQVANFQLPANQGFDAPRELPPGEEDPIKAMDDEDVVVMIETSSGRGPRAPARIRLADLEVLPSTAPTVPRGHRLAKRTFCFEYRCLAITVDFGGEQPDDELQRRVDEVLSSIAVDPK